MAAKRKSLLSGNPAKSIISMALPMLAGILGMVAFNLVDTFFVGRLGTVPLAAMSFTFPLVFIVNSIALGIGVGTSALASRAIGGGDEAELRRIVTSGLLLALVTVIVLVILLLPLLKYIFILLGADEGSLVLILDYMRIWVFGMPFVVIPMVGNNALRATGNTRTPALIMLIGASMNAVMDPLFIFGIGPFPFMGIKGAALATVIGRMTTLSFSLYILTRREHMLSTEGLSFSVLRRIWGQLFRLAVPATATNMIMPVSVGIVTRLIAVYGTDAVAGFGVATRIEALALSFMRALAAVMVPFVGQNSAAGQWARTLTGIRAGALYSLAWGALLALLLIPGRFFIGGIFSDSSAVIGVTTAYLLIVSGSYGVHGMLLIAGSGFNGLNKPFHSAMVSLSRMFFLYIPVAVIFRIFFGWKGVFSAAVASNILGGLFAYFWFVKTVRKSMADSSISAQ